jgi:hypothetical protein
MTRSRLTATEILHGARAYSHNASRRAHQLSGPKRVRVMHEPVGDASLNDGIDSPCEHCGYQICSCGPCATCGEVPYYCSGSHAYEPAPAVQPIPAPPAEQRFVVGQRVRLRSGFRFDDRAIGLIATVASWADADASPISIQYAREQGYTIPLKLDDPCINYGWQFAKSDEWLEPAPIAEAPAAESDEAVLRRCGWSGRPGASFLDYYLADGTALWVSQLGASPSWFRSGGDGETHNAPTLLQAACAALSIELVGRNGVGFVAVVGGQDVCGADAESCARAALLAYASRGKP